MKWSALALERVSRAPAAAEGFPQNILNKAECVIVFPSVLKFAIGIDGSYGRGAITCRTGKAHTGPWSAPAMMALEGGNIGIQLGGQATDFVLLAMNDRGADSVLTSVLSRKSSRRAK